MEEEAEAEAEADGGDDVRLVVASVCVACCLVLRFFTPSKF